MSTNNNFTIFYDDSCSFCRRFKILVEKFYKNEIKFIPISQSEKILPKISKESLKLDLHALYKEKLIVGREIIEVFIEKYPNLKDYLWLIGPNAQEKTSDFFYRSLKNIKKFSKQCTSCS